MVNFTRNLVVIIGFLFGGLFSAYGQDQENYIVSVDSNNPYVSIENNESLDDFMQQRITIDEVDSPFSQVLLKIAEKGNLRLVY